MARTVHARQRCVSPPCPLPATGVPWRQPETVLRPSLPRQSAGCPAKISSCVILKGSWKSRWGSNCGWWGFPGCSVRCANHCRSFPREGPAACRCTADQGDQSRRRRGVHRSLQTDRPTLGSCEGFVPMVPPFLAASRGPHETEPTNTGICRNRQVPAPPTTHGRAPAPARWGARRTRGSPPAGPYRTGLRSGSPEPASRRLPARVRLHLSLKPADTCRHHEDEDKVFKDKNCVDFEGAVLRNDQLVGLSRELLHSDHRDQ